MVAKSMARPDYYQILGVSPDSTPEEIRAAYRRRVKEVHPDRAGEQASEAFRAVQEAYEVLSDRERRRAYDQERARVPAASERWSGRFRDPSWVRFVESVVAGGAVPRGANYGRVNSGVEMPGVEVWLDPAEASAGGWLPLAVPYRQVCQWCRSRFSLACVSCGGRGWLEGRIRVEVRIPAGVSDGALVESLVQLPTGEQAWLQIRIRVGGW